MRCGRPGARAALVQGYASLELIGGAFHQRPDVVSSSENRPRT